MATAGRALTAASAATPSTLVRVSLGSGCGSAGALSEADGLRANCGALRVGVRPPACAAARGTAAWSFPDSEPFALAAQRMFFPGIVPHISNSAFHHPCSSLDSQTRRSNFEERCALMPGSVLRKAENTSCHRVSSSFSCKAGNHTHTSVLALSVEGGSAHAVRTSTVVSHAVSITSVSTELSAALVGAVALVETPPALAAAATAAAAPPSTVHLADWFASTATLSGEAGSQRAA
mmetsp:Transcript_20334/g.48843  ORF Transcript_20334/g.48843 Transcript_20334/m.48843 type:complete len:235 (+) Transcript_20334:1079-1783(+)